MIVREGPAAPAAVHARVGATGSAADPAGRGRRRSSGRQTPIPRWRRATRAVGKSCAIVTFAALSSCALEQESAPPALSAEQRVEQALRAELVAAARSQIGETTIYDGRYAKIAYPLGDPPRDRGVCADLVVRAYRDAAGIDLQRLLHEDMVEAFVEYPDPWGLRAPDPNIDHRRVINLEKFLDRIGARAPLPQDLSALEPGDLLTWRINGAEPHIGVVSDRRDPETGRPLIIHNFAKGAVEEDFLWTPGLVGRYRPNATALILASARFRPFVQ